jgi:hypothetical protein
LDAAGGQGVAEYFYADSTDNLKTFSAPQEVPGLSGTARHGTVIAD